MWKFNIPRSLVSTAADTKNLQVSTAVDTKTGLGVNRRTARCQPPLTQNPRRTPEVYKPLKQNTGCSHCLKTPMQANTYLGNSRQHKKTNSYKKTNVSKKTKPPLNFGRKIGAVRPENPDTLTGKSEQLGRKPVSDKPSYKPSYKPSMNRPNTRRAKTP